MGNSSADLNSFQRRYEWSAKPPSMAVVEAIASLEDVKPVHLGTVIDAPLYDFIDPGALDSIVAGENGISISFTVGGYDVLIKGDELRIGEK